jgi:hypothetical protein
MKREPHCIATRTHERREHFSGCRDDFLLAHAQGDHALAGAAIDVGLARIQEWQWLMRARGRVFHTWHTIIREGAEHCATRRLL